jgi:microsomal dipeptidase-like Zn-dependent dipeptidase
MPNPSLAGAPGRLCAALSLGALLGSCGPEEGPRPPPPDVFGQAHGCYLVKAQGARLGRVGEAYTFAEVAATPLRFQPTDLGTYALYDPEGGYVVDDDGRLVRQVELRSDVTEIDDTYVSGAEWLLEPAGGDLHLRNRRTGAWLAPGGLTQYPLLAADLTLAPAEGCAVYPELSVDATGAPGQTVWPDGDVYGFVDMHSHLLANFGFAAALFHGAPFHRLGVPHALPDCAIIHGEQGRKDFFGFAYDEGADSDLAALVPDMLGGELSFDNHATAGFPEFTEWPNSRKLSTHQVQYYRWLERAWLGGLRLVVQHATSNAVICNISVGEGWTRGRYDCEDMTGVDRQLDAVYELERYIDAQSGGPGEGWFRIATSPAQAREVIAAGKMAVLLGIETSDLFDCHLTPREGGPRCDEAHVDAQLDAYLARGVRVLFPNHKYDNAFTPGDGSNGVIEAGNFLNSGYFTNKGLDCPTDMQPGFDQGSVSFGGLLEPRDVFQSTPPQDLSNLPNDPILTMLPFFPALLEPEIPGDFCQQATFTDLGEYLLDGMMRRGLVIEVDHLPRRSYLRAFELLAAADYPAVGTHGRDNNARLYALGGLSTGAFGRCHDPALPGASLTDFRERLRLMTEAGMHRSLGFGFDFNGFAGGPGPRFGPEGCPTPQENPITYPFTSVDGAVTFQRPVAGERTFDFDTEGMVHIGLLPEYIEDARHDGATDEDLEALFRSAEGYLRMWERSESRGRALRGE